MTLPRISQQLKFDRNIWPVLYFSGSFPTMCWVYLWNPCFVRKHRWTVIAAPCSKPRVLRLFRGSSPILQDTLFYCQLGECMPALPLHCTILYWVRPKPQLRRLRMLCVYRNISHWRIYRKWNLVIRLLPLQLLLTIASYCQLKKGLNFEFGIPFWTKEIGGAEECLGLW